jgi:hypothetical protein
MTEDELLELVRSILAPLGCREAEGEIFADPPLEILTYHCRAHRLLRLPVVGRALSVVAVARRPPDLPLSDLAALAERVARAAHGRFPPWPKGVGLTIGLTTVLVSQEPIRPDDEALLHAALASASSRRGRVVPLGLFLANPAQKAVSFALRLPDGTLADDPTTLADGLSEHLGRFVPFLPA